MLCGNLEAFLHSRIPLCRTIGIRVRAVEADSLLLEAPLAPNINDHDAVFGGSVSALAIVSGWALVHTRLRAEQAAATVVIQRSSLEFERPITGPFAARSRLVAPLQWARFRDMLARRGRGRIEVQCVIESNGEVKATFAGAYVALSPGA